MHIVLVGSLSEGFKAFGPYENFDMAAEHHPGGDVWIMELDDSKLMDDK